MTYRGHTVGGMITAAALVPQLPHVPALLVATALACLIGALAPDLDEPGAFLSRRTGPLPYLIRFTLSNPLTWQLAGGPSFAHWPGSVPKRDRLASVWYDNVVVRWLLSAPLAELLASRSIAGHARMRALTGHRQLSHSFIGFTFAAAFFASIVALGCFLAVEYGLMQAAVISWTVVGQTAIEVPWYAPMVGWVTLGFAAGYLSHFVLDMMTVSGIPLFLPHSTRRFWVLPRPLRVRTH